MAWASELIEIASTDGTVVGVERLGDGPALLAVHGSTADRSRWAPIREQLAERFTVYLLDRRGRGASQLEFQGDYHIGRETEDVLATLDVIGESCFYLGHSYGALIGLDVLAQTDRIEKAFLYEPPFDTDGYEVTPKAFTDAYAALIDQDRRDDALDLFYREVVGLDPEPLHALPIWQARKAAAHTLVREGLAVADFVPDPNGFSGRATPTVILLGTESRPAFRAAAHRAAQVLPDARIVDAVGHGHVMIDADPQGFVGLVAEFFLAS